MGDVDDTLVLRRWRKEDPYGYALEMRGFSEADLKEFKDMEKSIGKTDNPENQDTPE